MWFSPQGQSPFGLAIAPVPAGCNGTQAPLACVDIDYKVVTHNIAFTYLLPAPLAQV